MHDPRAALLQHNIGQWAGCFIRFNGDGLEQERFPTSLSVKDSDGLIQACLTYQHTGQQRSMSFQTLPASMQVSPDGGWSLGPTSITPWSWVAELCVVHQRERRRIVVRHGVSGLEQVVYVVETEGSRTPEAPVQRLRCRTRSAAELVIWEPEDGVELLLDQRDRQTGDATACGLRWTLPGGIVRQMVRRYDTQGGLLPLSPAWP